MDSFFELFGTAMQSSDKTLRLCMLILVCTVAWLVWRRWK